MLVASDGLGTTHAIKDCPKSTNMQQPKHDAIDTC